MDIKGKKILLTGGNGFLGTQVYGMLQQYSAECFIPRSGTCNLTEQESVRKLFKDFKADIVIHCAVTGGGIGFMMRNPVNTFYNNLMMNTLVMEEARKNNVEKFVTIGTVCSYPKYTPVPFKEQDLWNGYPEETNAPYGLSKKMAIVQSEAYRQQYGFDSINLLLANLYGPGDNFHPDNSHVIPALVRKFCKAEDRHENRVEVWGSGHVSREFLYVEDAARAVVMATERYDRSEPVNIGTGCETTIWELVQKVAGITGFEGEIVWNQAKPDGQPRRLLDTTMALREFGFKAGVSLDDGLQRTVDWYRKQGDLLQNI